MGREGRRSHATIATQGPTCLSCTAALEPGDPAGICRACGFVNAKLDLDFLLSRERRLAALERTAKALILVLLALLALLLLAGARAAGSRLGLGWAVGLPIAVGLVLWETASKLTRRRPAFLATPLRATLIVGFAAAFAGLSLAPNVPMRGRLIAGGLGLALLGGAGAFVALGRLLERWRERYVLDGRPRAERRR